MGSIVGPDEIEKCFNALKSVKEVIVDTETSGIDWKENFVCGYVFTVGPREEDTWYLPLRHRGGGNIEGCHVPNVSTGPIREFHWVEKRLAEEIAPRTDLHWVGHNLKFDLHMMANSGIRPEGTVEDTQINAAMIEERMFTYSLDDCATFMKLEQGKKVEIYQTIIDFCRANNIKCDATPTDPSKAMAQYWTLPASLGSGYARQDGMLTLDLVNKQRIRIQEEELQQVWELEKRVTKTLWRMERRGVPVDIDRLDLVQKKMSSSLAEARIKYPTLKVRSPKELEAIFRAHNITNWNKTPKGAPSFKEEWLELTDLGQDIITIRKLENMRDTFIEKSVKENLYKGRVHTTFNQLNNGTYGTDTGRLSSSGPNMQQIPKRNKIIAPLLRQIYRGKNTLWNSKDFKSAEYRLFADFAGSKFVLDAYANDPDTDYHQLVADMLHIERDPTAKRLNLGVIYGMGYKKLALSLGVSEAEAKALLARMRNLMPEAKNFMDNASIRAERRGWIKTLLGRRRHFGKHDNTHKAGNSVIQGSCADVTKLKMVECDEYLVGQNAESMLLLQIHDSLEFEMVPEEEKLIKICKEIMEDCGKGTALNLTVPMKVDDSTGVSWGHATFPKYNQWV